MFAAASNSVIAAVGSADDRPSGDLLRRAIR